MADAKHNNPPNDQELVLQPFADAIAEAAKAGIAKGKKNQQQGYQFRGIVDNIGAIELGGSDFPGDQ